jgi:chaperonin GroES
MKVKPLYDRLIVKRIEEKEQRRGGIIIPDSAKEKPMEGKIVAVGAGRINKDGSRTPLEVKAGDRVLFGKYAGQEIKIDDKEHVILKEDEVLGIIS